MDVSDWLRSHGFQRYEPAFVANAIGTDVLLDLTEDDLEKLGVPLGDRKRLVRAIRAAFSTSRETPLANEVAKHPHAEQPRKPDAERRHLTVMICDLVGSTALSARLDPEDMRAVTDAYHAACARIVSSYDGFLAEFRGDGILAYFGYPHAHEDDAERTVRAGLDIVAAVARLDTRAKEPLAVRIGIATGLVVVGDLSGDGALREHSVVGQTPNIAGRLQGLGQPGSIVIAASTRRLLGDLFQLRDLGRHEVKGMAEPVAAWAVEGLCASETRFEAAHAGLSDLVGRARELDFLLECQRLAWAGKGQVVLISGEPGIGKSRLMAALADRIAGERHTRLRYQCSPYHTNSGLRPFILQIERAAEFKADDTPEQRLVKLEALLDRDAPHIRALVPLFAALLSIPCGERYPPLALTPIQQRRRTLAALLDLFEGLTRKQPILLLFEDAQWADATSLELLDLAIERVRELPVLALLTFRHDFEHPWVGYPNVATLALKRLEQNDVESVIARVTGGRALPGEVMKQIIAKTDGNPLFVEELTKAVLEAGILIEDSEGYRLDGPLPPLAIPATLQDSLMARLDRLAQVKEIAQVGAAIGREFPYPLVRDLVARDETALRRALTQLEQAELVFRRGEPPDAIYSFKHALVRDAAYETLLKSRRHQLHAQIGRVLQERFADIVASEPEIVAHHFTQAGLADSAVDYWLRAGNLSLSRSANAEAAKHLRQGVELIGQVSSPARARKELDLYLALGPAMAASEGFATAETRRIFSHARDLLGGGGTPKEQMTVLWGTYLARGMQAEHDAAREVARQFLALAENDQHPAVSALANRFMGQTLLMLGQFADARLHFERTVALCTANQETIVAFRRFGIDDQTGASSQLAYALCMLGYPEQSAAAARQALARARALGLVLTTALSLSHSALLGILCGNEQLAGYADEAAAYSAEHGLPNPAHWARFARGALMAQNGDSQRGIELMCEAMAGAEGDGDLTRRTFYLGHIASAHAGMGEAQTGLAVLDQAFEIMETANERFFEAELYRLRATMLSALGKKNEAEAALRRALATARQQEARWWELRAATTLARHLGDGGKRSEAYSVLQPVYSWFREGFDTRDLTDAKALLDELRDVSGLQTQAHLG
ncbi:MAG TPA: adenylate/guanylate cyclase domain-containing protein [Xanthobacteraceae bacterium]|jgi:class 3 adenylate cyclase/tetratricopeptide (TPR) repeat protein|nr:adenylate/guanylate cyclase domain-containing protein [Xanthobacteraceae bacterium]